MPQRRAPQLTLLLLACGCTLASQASLAQPPAALQLDKAEQHRLHVLTRQPDAETAVLLPAQVVADPRQFWRSMADQPGLIEAPVGGFPLAGRPVVAGQVLAWLRPALSEPERRDLQGRRAIAQQDFDVADLQVHRFDIDVAQDNTVSLQTPAIQIVADFKDAKARGGVLDQALNDRVPLTAPADGLLLTSLAQSQRVVVIGQPLFEGVGVGALAVELIYEDSGLDAAGATQGHVEDATQEAVGLHFLGEALDPKTRSHRVLYAVSAEQPLTVAQMLRVSLPRRQPGLRVPRSSVFTARGQAWVWVHGDSEHFEPRAVVTGVTDSGWLEVRQGLSGNERVVVDAATLVRRVPS